MTATTDTLFAHFVISTTGCTCCSSDNRIFGPFRELEHAKRCRDGNKATKQFASQYSKEGNHSIIRSQAEALPDGRIIVGSHVFSGWAEDTLDSELGHPDHFYYTLGDDEVVKDA